MVHLKSRNYSLALTRMVITILLTVKCVAVPAETGAKHPMTFGSVNVALVIGPSATALDFIGPAEVFADVDVRQTGAPKPIYPFKMYTVGETRNPVTLDGGMQVVPQYTFEDAPVPSIVVIGAQGGSPALSKWLKAAYENPKTEVIMSVCTGAFRLADAGLLDGKHATTHHEFLEKLSHEHPLITVENSARFVKSDDKVYTAAGLSSGIDLALHIASMFYGKEGALRAVKYMEYRGSKTEELVDK